MSGHHKDPKTRLESLLGGNWQQCGQQAAEGTVATIDERKQRHQQQQVRERRQLALDIAGWQARQDATRAQKEAEERHKLAQWRCVKDGQCAPQDMPDPDSAQ